MFNIPHHSEIGGWGNTLSAIRCGKVCERRYVEVSTPGIMDGSEYRRFWLSYDNGTIQVGKGGEVAPFMEWHDATHRVQVNYIGIARYKEPVSWIAYTDCDEWKRVRISMRNAVCNWWQKVQQAWFYNLYWFKLVIAIMESERISCKNYKYLNI